MPVWFSFSPGHKSTSRRRAAGTYLGKSQSFISVDKEPNVAVSKKKIKKLGELKTEKARAAGHQIDRRGARGPRRPWR